MIYILNFFLSSWLVKRSYLVNKKFLKKLIIIFALLIPCILAGVRKEIIGTDLQVYVKPMFQLAMNSKNFQEFLNGTWINNNTGGTWVTTDVEIGFSLLLYLITKIFRNFQVLLFLFQVIIVSLIYKGLRVFKNQDLYLNMLAYYFLCYVITFNIIRQCLAIAIIFYSFKYLFKKKYGCYLLFNILALFFHKSAIIGLVILLLYNISDNNRIKLFFLKIKIKNKIKIIILISILVLILFQLEFIINILQSLGLEKYKSYLKGEYSFLPKQFLLRIPFVWLIFKEYKKNKENKIYLFALLLNIIDLFLSQLGSVTPNSWRIAQYFSIYNIIFYPMVCDSGKYKIFKNLFLISYLIFYFSYTILILGNHEVYPYLFYWE